MTRYRNTAACLLGFFGLLGTSVVGCAPHSTSESARAPETAAPLWRSLFDGRHEITFAIRPRAMKRDGVFGAWFGALMRVAESVEVSRAHGVFEALESADEIVLGLSRGADATMVIRGVSASIDPERMEDASGRPLFRPASALEPVRKYELLDRTRLPDGALYVLPERVWLGTVGRATAHADALFARTQRGSESMPDLAPNALAALRIRGAVARALVPSLVAPSLQNVLHATASLWPGRAGIRVDLEYKDPTLATRGDVSIRETLSNIAEISPAFGWLKAATVSREGSLVTVTSPLPQSLLDELPRATGEAFGF